MIHPTIAIGSDAEVFIPPNLPSPREVFIFPLFRGCRKNNHLRRFGRLSFSRPMQVDDGLAEHLLDRVGKPLFSTLSPPLSLEGEGVLRQSLSKAGAEGGIQQRCFVATR